MPASAPPKNINAKPRTPGQRHASKKGANPPNAVKNRAQPAGKPPVKKQAAAAGKGMAQPVSPVPTGSRAAPPKAQARVAVSAKKKAAGRKAGAKKAARKLRPETAAQRRKDINSRRGVTPEQLEFMRRRREIKRYYVKKRRISAITLLLTRFTALVIIYVVLFALSSGLFALSLVVARPPHGEDVVYQLGENKYDTTYKVETLKYGERIKDGQVYLNFTEIAEYLDFITIGDLSRLRYLTNYSGGEEVVFEVGTTAVTVNGNMTRMPAPSYYESGALYVPLDFVETYIRGISVGVNEKNGRLVLYREYTLNTKNEKIYSDITFTLKPQTPIEHIDENTLPVDIKLATEPSRRPQQPDTGSA